MTTYFDEDFASDDPAPPGVGTMVNWAGALLSLALITGLGVWGYQLLVRDVTGVPVVRALEGPMRVAPDDPGGLRPEFQDLTVTRVASDGTEERPTEQVILAPAPASLADEDQPVPVLTEELEAAAAAEADAQDAPVVLPDADGEQTAIELAIAEALEETAPAEEAGLEEQTGGLVQIAGSGVRNSPRPFARPDRMNVVNAVATVSTPFATDGVEIAATDVPSGTRLVQLGAFPSIDRAREAWTSLEGRFGEYLTGKNRVVQEASAGGSTFYRLRAMGFEDLSDARRFCAVLVAENANCIPVIRR